MKQETQEHKPWMIANIQFYAYNGHLGKILLFLGGPQLHNCWSLQYFLGGICFVLTAFAITDQCICIKILALQSFSFYISKKVSHSVKHTAKVMRTNAVRHSFPLIVWRFYSGTGHVWVRSFYASPLLLWY
jgi:hypothetical protein